MVAAIAKVARYFTMAVYGLMCFWFVFGVGQVSAAGGFFAAVVAVVMLLRVMDGWNNVVAAAEYGCIRRVAPVACCFVAGVWRRWRVLCARQRRFRVSSSFSCVVCLCAARLVSVVAVGGACVSLLAPLLGGVAA